jgi:hypothetical protein
MSNLNPTTNQRQWEHKAHTANDKDNTTQKTKEMNNLLCVPYVPIVSGLLLGSGCSSL